MAKYTEEQITSLLRQAGFPESAIPTMVRIAQLESNNDSNAFNDNPNTGDLSYGLFQINMLGKMGPERRKWFGIKSNEELLDPLTNAKAAYKLWSSKEKSKGENQGFTHWTTYNKQIAGREEGTNIPSRSTKRPFAVKGKGFATGDISSLFDAQSDNTVDLSFMQALANLAGLDYLVAGLTDGSITPAQAETAIANSKFFKTTFAEKREALAAKQSDPATFNRDLRNLEDEIKQVFVEAGVEYNATQVKKLAYQAIMFDITQEDFVKIVADSIDFESSFLKGLANTYAVGIRNIAESYGVTLPDGSKELKSMVKAKFTGAMSDDDIKNVFKQEAIKAFPNYKARFDAGATLADIADPFRKEIAEVLELNPDDIGYNDSVLKSVLTATNPKDGSPYAMSRADVIKLAKNDPRYDQTKKAQDELLKPLFNLVGGYY